MKTIALCPDMRNNTTDLMLRKEASDVTRSSNLVRVACEIGRAAFSRECVITILPHSGEPYVRIIPIEDVVDAQGNPVIATDLPEEGEIAGFVRGVLQGCDNISATVRVPSTQSAEYIVVARAKVQMPVVRVSL